MSRSNTPSTLRQWLEDRELDRSDTRDEFDRAREDDASKTYENAHLRKEEEIDRAASALQPSNQNREKFEAVLAQKGQLRAEFDPAREDDASISHEIPLDRDDDAKRMDAVELGSQRFEPKPELKPRPPQEVSKSVDRETFAERWAAEMERAGNDVTRDNSQDHDRTDRGLDLDRERER